MIEVHHLENSRSQRVVWLLEELGAEFEVVTHRRDPQTLLAPDTLRELHPLGKSPLIRDRSRSERVLAESGAILDYLVEHHDPERRLVPPSGSEAFERYRFWMHHAEGSAMPPLVMRLVFSRDSVSHRCRLWRGRWAGCLRAGWSSSTWDRTSTAWWHSGRMSWPADLVCRRGVQCRRYPDELPGAGPGQPGRPGGLPEPAGLPRGVPRARGLSTHGGAYLASSSLHAA